MKDMEIKGVKIRVTKYKVIIFDPDKKIGEKEATTIALYLRDEGFIKKDEFPIEIIHTDD